MADLKSIIITGANRGLGLGFTRYYLKKGWKVTACCRNVEKAVDLISLSKKYQNTLKIKKLNVSDKSSIDKLSEAIVEQNSRFDIVINNAGINIEEGLGNWTSKAFIETFQTNSIGVALFSQAIISCINNRGKLINMSSGLGSIALNINPEMAFEAYAMSKAALNIFTKRLASKSETKNLVVIALSPGWVKTDMGGKEALLTIPEAIRKLGAVIDNLCIEDSGKFFSEDGDELPW